MNKNTKDRIKKIIKGILLSPVYLMMFLITFLPCTVFFTIVAFTKGKEKNFWELSEFTEKIFKMLGDDIKAYLDIDTLPEVMVDNLVSREMGNFKKLGMFSFDFSFYSRSRTIIEGDNIRIENQRGKITIFPNSIYKISFKHNLFVKIKIVNTIVHELTHYRQFLQDVNFNKNYVCASDEATIYNIYKKQPIEVEARKYAFIYCAKNLLKIIKLSF